MGYQFMRQKPILKYIVDFYCSKLKLIIEVDGDTHVYKLNKDKIWQKKLEAIGLKFLRFDDLDVKLNIDGVINAIVEWIKKILQMWNRTKKVPLTKGGFRGLFALFW